MLFVCFSLCLFIMAKKKNHTAQNQNKKAHKNGIHKPKRQKFISLKGRDPKFVRNLRYAKAKNNKDEEDGEGEEE